MASEKLNDWLQFIGAGGIIASLVFVGIQLKQSQDIAIAAQYQARFESAVETSRSQLQSESALRMVGQIFANAIQKDSEIPDGFKAWVREQSIEELGFRLLTAHINLKTADNLYFQYQSGFLSDEAWLAFRNELRSTLMVEPPESFFRGMYEFRPDHFRASFRDFLDKVIAEVDAETLAAPE